MAAGEVSNNVPFRMLMCGNFYALQLRGSVGIDASGGDNGYKMLYQRAKNVDDHQFYDCKLM